jgi:site-specific DNA-methyltransferase (adenine-specific)
MTKNRFEIYNSDCIEQMKKMIEQGVQIDSCVCDPPYHLQSIVKRFSKTSVDDETKTSQNASNHAMGRLSKGFMGKSWDGGDIAFQIETWKLVYDLLKPGGHLIAFSGTRTYHRMACAIEDAGFEIRDQLGWMYGTGFPKSHNISKSIDRQLGKKPTVIGTKETKSGGFAHIMKTNVEQGFRPEDYYQDRGNILNETVPTSDEAKQWDGWGSALKPAWEPIVLARKPLSEDTIAENVLKHGVGGLNINGCRVHLDGDYKAKSNGRPSQTGLDDNYNPDTANIPDSVGRWPANIIHDGSDEVLDAFPNSKGQLGKAKNGGKKNGQVFGDYKDNVTYNPEPRGDIGSAARFFYSAKATKEDRAGSKHPTIKPLSLMRHLCKLITPPGGIVMDPFAGSGTTLQAAIEEGFYPIGIEREKEYFDDITNRLNKMIIKRKTTEFYED